MGSKRKDLQGQLEEKILLKYLVRNVMEYGVEIHGVGGKEDA